ncbi:hypothetical protein Tco_0682964 [Tanacetum coccineum]|uniref:Reverse transcriptase domain-containing protein n=1 Tax=Tanacetum coccineum TaxID=301880 RepID=A0ABQ4XSW5_9ASTR
MLKRRRQGISEVEYWNCYALQEDAQDGETVGLLEEEASASREGMGALNRMQVKMAVLRDDWRRAELLAHQEQQRRARQPGPEARILDHQDATGMLGCFDLCGRGQIDLVLMAYSRLGSIKKKMTDKYCPQGEIKKLEIELWNLKVKGNDVLTYTERFQELTLICTKFVANETEKIDKNQNATCSPHKSLQNTFLPKGAKAEATTLAELLTIAGSSLVMIIVLDLPKQILRAQDRSPDTGEPCEIDGGGMIERKYQGKV